MKIGGYMGIIVAIAALGLTTWGISRVVLGLAIWGVSGFVRSVEHGVNMVVHVFHHHPKGK
jgi:hypothetical protein